jgi:hypothetical protein
MTANDDELGQLCLQVQMNLALQLNPDSLKEASERIAKAITGIRGVGRSEGDDDGRNLNVTFAAESPATAWQELKSKLLESGVFGSSLRECAMVACTGNDGWNDYRLLHHFDPTVGLDATNAG